MAKRSTKIRTRQDPAHVMAKSLLPASQAKRGEFTIVDVANHSEGDQRHAVRSGETRTIRRKPKLHCLFPNVLNLEQVLSCEWYLGRYLAGYETVGITANYGGTGGGGDKGFTHLAKSNEQMIARREYQAARASIDPLLIALFERVVIHGRPMGRLGLSFRLAVSQLEQHMQDVGVAA